MVEDINLLLGVSSLAPARKKRAVTGKDFEKKKNRTKPGAHSCLIGFVWEMEAPGDGLLTKHKRCVAWRANPEGKAN